MSIAVTWLNGAVLQSVPQLHVLLWLTREIVYYAKLFSVYYIYELVFESIQFSVKIGICTAEASAVPTVLAKGNVIV